MKMNTNTQIADKIRRYGRLVGLDNDFQITKKAGCYSSTIADIVRLKTAPRLDTLCKFADLLGITVEDLIYDRTDADVNLSRLINQLSEYEKTKVAVYIEMMVAEKNKESAGCATSETRKTA